MLTGFGWLLVLKGAVSLLAPDKAQWSMERGANSPLGFVWAGGMAMAVGGWASYCFWCRGGSAMTNGSGLTKAVEKKLADEPTSIIHSDPDTLGGVPVFRGTRVPVHSLFEYLAAGETLDVFLDHFPTVARERAMAVLKHASTCSLDSPVGKLEMQEPNHRGRQMAVSIESLGIDRLSVAERLELIEQIWNSLPEQVSLQEIPEWHLAELAQRRARSESQPAVGKPWPEALQQSEPQA